MTTATTYREHFTVTFDATSLTYTDAQQTARITAVYTPGQPIHAFTDPLHARTLDARLIEDRITTAAHRTGYPGITFFHPASA